MTRITLAELLAIMVDYRDVENVIHPIIAKQYDDTVKLLQDAIGTSHMGCAGDEVLIDLQDGTV